MGSPRRGHTATLLRDGRVLVVGGLASGVSATAVASAELYDPAIGSWTPTGAMLSPRSGQTATLLLDGRVLVAGGFGSADSPASAELYDPGTGTWAVTGQMVQGRSFHTATLLLSGKVLVVGGLDSNGDQEGTPPSPELYDPELGSWAATGRMIEVRTDHSATLLPDGMVLVAGGATSELADALASVELYDPSTGTWTATGTMLGPRKWHAATLLSNGLVLVAGGYMGDLPESFALDSAELYDPGSRSWATTGRMIQARLQHHTAVTLTNGEALVVGGSDGQIQLVSAELYDPGTGTWTVTGSVLEARWYYTITLLANGKVLVTGGHQLGRNDELASAELYNPRLGT